ncbi:MAG: hypothetical protein IKK89_02565 [Alistipes sp.]|nr:hypothetical protein [Alistipes sp.]MBR3589606.1 hypothetical protein [Alistipes sp.]MBR3892746.1 hypothetical protein [Alistipes sp.]MBR6630816.1 hypothetical protein [Alistipes sp.]
MFVDIFAGTICIIFWGIFLGIGAILVLGPILELIHPTKITPEVLTKIEENRQPEQEAKLKRQRERIKR